MMDIHNGVYDSVSHSVFTDTPFLFSEHLWDLVARASGVKELVGLTEV